MSYIRKVRFLARTFILSASYRRCFFTRFRLAVFFYLNERDYSKYFIGKSINHLHGNDSLLNGTRVRPFTT